MTAPQRFRKKPVEVEAMQWLHGDEHADALWGWTATPSPAMPGAVKTMFMVLGEDDSYEVFRAYDEDLEIIPGNEVDQRLSEGYTACIYVDKSGQWANLRRGDWVIRENDGSGFYPCAAEVFAATYEAVN